MKSKKFYLTNTRTDAWDGFIGILLYSNNEILKKNGFARISFIYNFCSRTFMRITGLSLKKGKIYKAYLVIEEEK